MKAKLIVATAMVALVLSFSAQNAVASTRGPKSVQDRVTHELNMLPYVNVFDYMNFTVDGNGTVTLTGDVTNATVKNDASKALKNVEGVERVDNQIKVLPASFMDQRLRAKLYRSIYGESVLQRYSLGANASIRIIVDNGHVTLIGFVDNQADRIIAGMQANSVPGIFSVDNQLKVVKG
jgi:osmotically-inducible protein OsmY